MVGSTRTTVKRAADKPKTAKAAPRVLKTAPDTSSIYRTDLLLRMMIDQLDAMTTAINDLVAVLTP